MNVIKIYLSENGDLADLQKDFTLRQREYHNKLLNVYIPTSLLMPAIYPQYIGADGAVGQEIQSYSAVKIGMIYTKRTGKLVQSQPFYMRFLKNIMRNSIEYALYERLLPKSFTLLEGQGENAPILQINAVNIFNDPEWTTPRTDSIIVSQQCSLDVMPGAYIDEEPPTEPSDLETLYARIDLLTGIVDEMQSDISKFQNLLLPPDNSEANKVGNFRVEITPDGRFKFIEGKGEKGEKGEDGKDGKDGEKGEQGDPLTPNKFYPTVAAMNADLANAAVQDIAIIQSLEGSEHEDNAKLYECVVLGGVKQWLFISDLSGAKGADGKDGKTPNHYWQNTILRFERPDGTYDEGVNLIGPTGPPGPSVATGMNPIKISADRWTFDVASGYYWLTISPDEHGMGETPHLFISALLVGSIYYKQTSDSFSVTPNGLIGLTSRVQWDGYIRVMGGVSEGVDVQARTRIQAIEDSIGTGGSGGSISPDNSVSGIRYTGAEPKPVELEIDDNLDIVDDLDSDATDMALSANQGRVLKELIDTKISAAIGQVLQGSY